MLGGMFTLLTEGPFNTLTEQQILKIYSYIDGKTAINALLRTSKRMYKLFSTDLVWSKIPFSFCKWCGAGSFGIEDTYWEKIKDDAGLVLLSIYRLRWMSHHYSKLKLFYGAARFEDPSSFHALFRWKSHPVANAIVIVSGTESPQLMEGFLNQLHFVIPESATEYHLSRECKPYLAEAMVLNVEPSPRNSRSRRLYRDPGTLVECSILDLNFKYRRIGDPRLTFLGVDLPTARTAPYNQEPNYPLFYQLTAHVSCLSSIPLQFFSKYNA